MRPPNISDAGSRREDPCYPLDLWEDLPELIQHGLGLNGPGEMDKDFRVHCMVPAQVEQGLTQEVLVIPAEGLNDFSQFRKRVRARTGSKVGVIGDIVIPEEEPKKVSLGETIDTARERLIFLMDASSGAMQRSLEDEKYRRRFLGGVAERLWDDWLAPHLKNPQCPDEDHLALNKWHQVAMREVEAYVTDPNQL
ncbi:hypothetical protein HOM98_02000, partial [Candidatus Peregrinibacteria bacterium]|nr:hypothetical protein [Candidatus Peregrinibacteria bacterium]